MGIKKKLFQHVYVCIHLYTASVSTVLNYPCGLMKLYSGYAFLLNDGKRASIKIITESLQTVSLPWMELWMPIHTVCMV